MSNPRYLAVAALLVLTLPARPQAPAEQGPRKIYTRVPQFRLPFNLEEVDRAKIREVLLYVKAGNEPWAHKDTATPVQTYFTFRAPGDGQYGFTIVVVDKGGNATPADVTRQPPGLVVVVDTQPPEVVVKETPTPGTGPWFRCEVSDVNPDPAGVRLEYQRPDGAWRQLQRIGEGQEVFCFAGATEWPDEREWTGKIRATATDLAGNTTSREFTFKPTARSTGSIIPAGHLETRSEKPNALPPLAAEPMPANPVLEKTATSPPRQIVNATHVSLDYRIEQQGPSGVGKVEVWMTRDNGQNWLHLCDDPDRRSPVEIDLPGEGVFGITLVVTNGNGVGDPSPVRGDSPDLWIEVDTTKPIAQLISARPGTGPDAGYLILTYEARDRNLGPEPIGLYYATRKEGPWQPIARALKNEGTYRWAMPRDLGSEVYFRLEVIDRAGNLARSELAERIVVDTTRPRARVLGVTTGGIRTVGN